MNDTQTYSASLIKALKQMEVKNLKSKTAYKLELAFASGYIAAMPEGSDKEFLLGFMNLMYLSGRSFLTLSQPAGTMPATTNNQRANEVTN
jgi:hypothetical protein